MKHLLIALIVLAWGAMSRAAEPTAPPTTQPSKSKVLLLPFTPLDAADRPDGIGRGVQQNLAADVSHMRALEPVTIDAQPPAGGYDTASAMKAAKDAGAQYVVYGTYQHADSSVRISGVVVDVQAGQTMGGLKATGDLRDVFDLQDAISSQARRVLRGSAAGGEAGAAPVASRDYGNDGPLTSPYSRQMEQLDSDAARSLDNIRMSTDYVDPWGYPYYGGYCYPSYGYYPYNYWPYWGWGGVVFINSGHDHHDDHHDHDGHHDHVDHHNTSSFNHAGTHANTHLGMTAAHFARPAAVGHAGFVHSMGSPAMRGGFSAGGFRGGSAAIRGGGGGMRGGGGGMAMHGGGGGGGHH
jgi:TolB-like protein